MKNSDLWGEGMKVKIQLKDIASYSKGQQINNADLLEDGEYDYLNGGIMPSGKWSKYNTPGETVTISEGGNSCGYVNYMRKPFWCGAHCYFLFNTIENTEYLYYALKSQQDRLMNIRTGACMPNIKKNDLGGFELTYEDDKAQQEVIVTVLKKIETIIAYRKQQLQTLDNLVKARFVEMFGMPGVEKSNWEILELGSICDINPKKNHDKRLISSMTVSFVPMQAVSEDGKIDATAIKSYDEVKTGFTYFAENDVLFAKITPCMENGKGAVARGLHNGIGFGSTEFHVLRPINNKANSEWIYTLTALPQFRIDAANNMTGSAGQRRVPASFLEKYRVAVPPIEMQNQFAAFVAQVDKSKYVIQQSLDKAQILFDSLMQEYFG